MRDVITEHGAIKQLIIENVLDPGNSLQAELDAREMTQRQLATIAGMNKSKPPYLRHGRVHTLAASRTESSTGS